MKLPRTPTAKPIECLTLFPALAVVCFVISMPGEKRVQLLRGCFRRFNKSNYPRRYQLLLPEGEDDLDMLSVGHLRTAAVEAKNPFQIKPGTIAAVPRVDLSPEFGTNARIVTAREKHYERLFDTTLLRSRLG